MVLLAGFSANSVGSNGPSRVVFSPVPGRDLGCSPTAGRVNARELEHALDRAGVAWRGNAFGDEVVIHAHHFALHEETMCPSREAGDA
ncbi:hypothetical protein ACNKHS_16255 [Shigella flexneri]